LENDDIESEIEESVEYTEVSDKKWSWITNNNHHLII
jgi:hypothetical protein